VDADSSEPVLLFSYGTLQQPEVQLATFGRRLSGRPDALAGWSLEPLTITDPYVISASGLAVHHMACPTGKDEDRIEGVVFALTETELAAADRYEVDDMQRIAVRLESGTEAFVYVSARS
jgi:hypothetical protein